MMIDLTDTATVARRALDAYEDGTLQAITTPGIDHSCSYVGPCGIGVSIPVDKRAELDNYEGGSAIFSLIKSNLVAGDSIALSDIQSAHDRWTTAWDDERAMRETEFLGVTTFYAMGLDK